jgi:hypothetical protein
MVNRETYGECLRLYFLKSLYMKRSVLFFFWFVISTQGYAYDFEIDGIFYSIVSLEDKTVSVVSGGNETYQGNIFIPTQVVYNGKTLSVIKIGDWAFMKCNITSIQLSEGLLEIGAEAFSECNNLKEIIVPNSVLTIGNNAFSNCKNLSYVKLPNTLKYLGRYSFYQCYNLRLHSERLPSTLAVINSGTFKSCGQKRISIPNTLETIDNAFDNCRLNYLKIEDGENTISLGAGDVYSSPGYDRYFNGTFTNCKIDSLYLGRNLVYKTGKERDYGYYNNYETPFYKNDGIKYLNIGISVTNIPTFSYSSINVIICQSEKPFEIDAGTFSNSTYAGAILYVPIGSKSLYESSENWNKFFNIQEMDIKEMNNNSEYKKCDTPIIGYSNGKLTFNCSTEGAVCNSTIKDSDIRSYKENVIQLGVTYSISVYATKNGFADSDVANATLCWIDVEPKSEGIINNVAQVKANAVLIQSDNGKVTVFGIDNGTNIVIYSASGHLIGSAKASGNKSSIITNLKRGEIAIVKIGEKSVKVVMQ